ncbi:rhodanese-like domain-containing protein [Lacticaseibacillus pabuli]|uniref:Rhodanese-like domain-containing protein n=1 Tax=Lacticaseibacillus pabuli TaxID=3025672 RepID=A0ABY7WVS5_9LACO|nr:rhodanese-like domain-containing protein [Lacticaseibacillus sp. KACC 23028]WDF83588.1 rhodanese-like domain-containing protein [Lacticaseibacillus sp. KACC 23028]
MFAAGNNGLLYLVWAVIGAILVVWAVSWLYRYIMTRRYKQYGGEIDGAQFEETMRKAQVIDLRESRDFHKSHVMGARNVPYSQFKEKIVGLRKDLPIYMYDMTGAVSLRAARRFQKAGFTQIYWLKNGFDQWSGKTKSDRH